MDNQLAVFIDFENIALWADREFMDFELTPLIEYLQSRGPAVVKRAYGDWSRFSRYRDEVMNLSIDLVQIYSVRAGKNRADIRMAIDALEIAMSRAYINTFVVVSGDSDFSPLMGKLREYGRYTIGIGPRAITHHLLVRSCDEFIYLETILGETPSPPSETSTERQEARALMMKALQAHGQRGELPVLAARLKQTMLSIDPAFNEVNLGYAQFKAWLEENRDLVNLFARDLQIYVSPGNSIAPAELGLNGGETKPAEETMRQPPPTLEQEYRRVFNGLKMISADFDTRRDILRDIFRQLTQRPGEFSTDELLDELQEHYELEGLDRSKSFLRDILQMAFRQRTFEYENGNVSLYVPMRLARGIESESAFISRAESDFAYQVMRAGLELDLPLIACFVLDDSDQVEYAETLLDDLRQRGLVVRKGNTYTLVARTSLPDSEDPALAVILQDIQNVRLPASVGEGLEAARSLAKTAMVQRSQDFVASAANYLYACRLQYDAVENGESGATSQDLRWYMASYAAANAGKLSQVVHDYAGARPYYLAFFSLVREEEPLWARMRGLINPMLAYYWRTAGRELDVNLNPGHLSPSSPVQVAVAAATHPNVEVRRHWSAVTRELAQVNPELLRRMADQIVLQRGDSPEYAQVAEQIRHML